VDKKSHKIVLLLKRLFSLINEKGHSEYWLESGIGTGKRKMTGTGKFSSRLGISSEVDDFWN